MKITDNGHRYIEWINPEDMHEVTLMWLSELNFIKDEQSFLNYLIKHYTLLLIDEKVFKKTKEMVDILSKTEKEIDDLITKIQKHQNGLEIMIDEKDELDLEKQYRNKHRELILATTIYFQDYRALKTKLFDFISTILKKEKNKRLLN